jgi:hypothetical protein
MCAHFTYNIKPASKHHLDQITAGPAEPPSICLSGSLSRICLYTNYVTIHKDSMPEK